MFLIEHIWNIELNVLDFSKSLCKTERKHLDFCLKIFITSLKEVLSICQTHSVTTHLDQVQMFLVPQIYFASPPRQRVRFSEIFAVVISTASFKTCWFNVDSAIIVLILEVCLTTLENRVLSANRLSRAAHTNALSVPTALRGMLPEASFVIARLNAGSSEGAVSWNTLVECVKLHQK